MPEDLFKYFPLLSAPQKEKLSLLGPLYSKWNSMINVISRKDIENFYTHHVLHSLSIAKVIQFKPGTRIIDIGTGGGFPGVPLAIIFPDSQFTLLDSIEKKIKVVSAVAGELDIRNISPVRKRAEQEKEKFDFVVSRAVSEFGEFVKLTRKNISGKSFNTLPNGIFYLKGGDLNEELLRFRNSVKIWEIKDFFHEPFFETKKIVYLPANNLPG